MKTLLKIVIPIVIVILALVGFRMLKASRPPLESREPPKVVPIADVVTVEKANYRPPVQSFGTVQPYFETSLTPQISGRLETVSESFRVGLKVTEGEVLATIDAIDYRAAVAQREADLVSAQRMLEEEEIRASQAAEDWKASGRDLADASPFVLREPQLAAATAAIKSAEAAVTQARANVERTQIRAPFDAVVISREASIGQQASPQSALGVLVATEKVEIPIPLTAEQRARVLFPSDESITVTSPTLIGQEWQGRLTRLGPTIDRNQIITIIAEVVDPFADDAASLPLGAFVNVQLPATALEASYQIPDSALVNDQFIWSVDDQSRLQRLDVERLHGAGDEVYVRPVDGDEKTELTIVSRPLVNFEAGLEVTTRSADAEEGQQP